MNNINFIIPNKRNDLNLNFYYNKKIYLIDNRNLLINEKPNKYKQRNR